MFGSPERSLKAFVQFSPLAVVELGMDGLVKLWNPAAERMFGWRKAWLKQRKADRRGSLHETR